MRFDAQFRRPEGAEKLLKAIGDMAGEPVRLMEVCGTHTMAIAKSGLRSVLPPNIKLLSGPGCPVCVTPPQVIDQVLALAARENVILATYGDMIKVPGSIRGESLQVLKQSEKLECKRSACIGMSG